MIEGGERAATAVCIVTHNSAADLPSCLAGVARLDHRPLELVVVDCASSDGSADLALELAPAGVPTRVMRLEDNVGFAGGMNAALGETTAPFVLALNPDARPAPDYLSRLVDRMEGHPEYSIAAVVGRLVRPMEHGGARRLDACGMRLTLTWRHLDRGSERLDRGQFAAPQRVFGATGAASLYRRAALDDAAVDGEVFATEFHSFREDAELCFRLRERGWEVVYEPAARCEHRRSSTPRRRRELAPEVNRHSLKNRYLLRAYHGGLLSTMLTLVPATARDLLALVYVTLFERSSLEAYSWLWRNRRQIAEKRHRIRRRRVGPSWATDRWFLLRGLPL